MLHSEAIDQIAAALAGAQAELSDPTKSKVAKVQTKAGGTYSFEYATLADGLSACRESLPKHGLAYSQIMSENEKGLWLRTMLMHRSGQWIASDYPIRPVENTPQGLGSALTYGRRYALFALVGIAPEDDDGNAASGNRADIQHRGGSDSKPSIKPTPPPSQEPPHLAYIRKAIGEIALCADQLSLIEWWRRNKGAMDKLATISQSDYDGILAVYDERKEQVPEKNLAGAA